MAIAKGDVVLVEFPFTDLSQSKLRPGVVLVVNLAIDEITLCFISSQQVDRLDASEFALLDSDPDFPQTGLRISDVLSYLASGMTTEEVLEDFPYLTRNDILACLAYAADREQKTLTIVA